MTTLYLYQLVYVTKHYKQLLAFKYQQHLITLVYMFIQANLILGSDLLSTQ